MLCSDCNKPILPVVAVDIDGTLGQYHVPIQRFMENFWNLPDLLPSWDGSPEDQGDYLGLTKDQWRQGKLAYRQGGYKRIMPLYPDAVLMVNELFDSGKVEVWLTTTRPWQRLDSVDPDTRFWLNRHGFKYHHLLFGDDKMWDLREIVGDRVIMVVDDLPEIYDRAEALWPGAAHMVARRHNEATRGERRTTGLIHVYNKIFNKTGAVQWRS